MIDILSSQKKFEIMVGNIFKYISSDLGIFGIGLAEYGNPKMIWTDDDQLSLVEASSTQTLPIITLPIHCWMQLLTKALRTSGAIDLNERIRNFELDLEEQFVKVST